VKRFISLGAALAAVLSIGAGSALAIPVPGTIDQQQTMVSDQVSWSEGHVLAQTFTAGVTGNLVAVGVYVRAFQPEIPAVNPAPATDPPFNIRLGVTTTSAGLPTETFLYGPVNAELPGSIGWQYFVFPVPAPIAAGTKYAIAMASASPFYVDWAGECQTDNYTGGAALVLDESKKSPAWQTVVSWGTNADSGAACMQDFAFKTFVESTEPTPFESFQGQTATPGSTPPPTSTDSPRENGFPSVPLLVLASLAAAAAFVTVKRIDTIRR
jgi:hypothetical protein